MTEQPYTDYELANHFRKLKRAGATSNQIRNVIGYVEEYGTAFERACLVNDAIRQVRGLAQIEREEKTDES